MNELFARRFQELEASRKLITFVREGEYEYIPDGQWQGWATSTQSLLRAVFGEAEPQYVNFAAAYAVCLTGAYGTANSARSLFHLFTSAKEDFEGGYVFNVDLRVSGEVFGNFVVLARKALDERTQRRCRSAGLRRAGRCVETLCDSQRDKRR